MNSVKILEENQELKFRVEQLLDFGETLLEGNIRKDGTIEKLSLEQIETNNKIADIFSLLVPEVEENNFLQTDSKSASTDDMLDVIRTLAKALLHDNESFEREDEVPRDINRK